MDLNKIESLLTTKTFGKPLSHKAEVPSTNTWAMEEAVKGAKPGSVFLADYQTQGQGRMGRKWEAAPKENILLSLIDQAPKDKALTPQINLVAGVAMADTLNTLEPSLKITLKWPNDIIAGGKKLGGMLSISDEDKVILGIGINVNAPLAGFSPEVAKKATSLLIATKKMGNREAIVAGFLNSYERWRAKFDSEGLGPIVAYWKQHSAMLGKKVEVVEAHDRYSGTACDLDQNGFLIVDTGKEKRTVISGDVLFM